jgi:hypothetical protein
MREHVISLPLLIEYPRKPYEKGQLFMRSIPATVSIKDYLSWARRAGTKAG